jgi:CheY-like chemotaxis protein
VPHSALRYPEESSAPEPQTAGKPLRVLLAEDNPADVLLIREALSAHFDEVQIVVQEDGEQMMHWIDALDSGNEAGPDVILLDLNMPRVTGREVLWRLRYSPVCRGVPTIIVTSSNSPGDRNATARLGAVRYFPKPTDYDEFMQLGELVKNVVSSWRAAATEESQGNPATASATDNKKRPLK